MRFGHNAQQEQQTTQHRKGQPLVWDCTKCGARSHSNKFHCYNCGEAGSGHAILRKRQQALSRLHTDPPDASVPFRRPPGRAGRHLGEGPGAALQQGPRSPHASAQAGGFSMGQAPEDDAGHKLKNYRRTLAMYKDQGDDQLVKVIEEKSREVEQVRDAQRTPGARLQAALQSYEALAAQAKEAGHRAADLREQLAEAERLETEALRKEGEALCALDAVRVSVQAGLDHQQQDIGTVREKLYEQLLAFQCLAGENTFNQCFPGLAAATSDGAA